MLPNRSKQTDISLASVSIAKLIFTPNIPRVENKTTLTKYLSEVSPKGWEKLFESLREELLAIAKCLKGVSFFPLLPDLFTAYHMLPLHKVKVVILEQEPYTGWAIDGKPHATGTSFGVRKTDKIPPTLSNIFKEWNRALGDKKFPMPKHGDLTSWAVQGVMLLNTSLTCEEGDVSHKSLWCALTMQTLEMIQLRGEKVIFVLWGNCAQKHGNKIKGNNIFRLETSHPSPMSFSRGFDGCNHAITINEKLLSFGKEPIIWAIPD